MLKGLKEVIDSCIASTTKACSKVQELEVVEPSSGGESMRRTTVGKSSIIHIPSKGDIGNVLVRVLGKAQEK